MARRGGGEPACGNQRSGGRYVDRAVRPQHLGPTRPTRATRPTRPRPKAQNTLVSSATPAVHFLRKHDVSFTEHEYRYEQRGGTRVSAHELGVEEHAVIKTLVMEDDSRNPIVVLMHGDREVSTRQLARQTNRKSIVPCAPAVATKHTGYLVGGTSPFGMRKALPVFMERSILDLDRVYINGGRRGFLVSLAPAEIGRVLNATLVDAAI
jgi:Cys-tRNA(Pro) deacylase